MMPKTSIIIVSYNSLHETTAPCLKSIFASSPGGDYEVIVVDNNSSDETVAWLTDLMERELRLKCIFNHRNRGFAGGNNDGIRIASGEFIVLLNSDCMVSGNWMRDLTAPLSVDRSIGITGPVSNAVGNEQKIFTTGDDPEEIMREGSSWVSRSGGSSFETDMLVFFCVAFRKELVDRLGPLDENFGLGFWEDDDYCARARKAGYRLVCVEDVFVYHRGGGSFGNAGVSTGKLMKENRGKLEKKHGKSNRLHPRWRHLRVIERYLSDAAGGKLSHDLKYRISNRIKVIETILPRGPVKRYFFLRHLNKLKARLAARGF